MEKTEKPRKSAKQNRRIVQPELLDGKRGLGRKTSRKDMGNGAGVISLPSLSLSSPPTINCGDRRVAISSQFNAK